MAGCISGWRGFTVEFRGADTWNLGQKFVPEYALIS